MSEMHQTPRTSIPALTLGWRLQMALAHAGLTIEGMADEMGVSRSTISRWINEHGAPPRKAFVAQWALRCGVSHEWLSTGADNTQQDGPDHPDNGSAEAPHTPRTLAGPASGCVTAADNVIPFTMPRAA